MLPLPADPPAAIVRRSLAIAAAMVVAVVAVAAETADRFASQLSARPSPSKPVPHNLIRAHIPRAAMIVVVTKTSDPVDICFLCTQAHSSEPD